MTRQKPRHSRCEGGICCEVRCLLQFSSETIIIICRHMLGDITRVPDTISVPIIWRTQAAESSQRKAQVVWGFYYWCVAGHITHTPRVRNSALTSKLRPTSCSCGCAMCLGRSRLLSAAVIVAVAAALCPSCHKGIRMEWAGWSGQDGAGRMEWAGWSGQGKLTYCPNARRPVICSLCAPAFYFDFFPTVSL